MMYPKEKLIRTDHTTSLCGSRFYFGSGSEGAGAKGATELMASSSPDWVLELWYSKAPIMTAKNKSAMTIGVRVILRPSFLSVNLPEKSTPALASFA